LMKYAKVIVDISLAKLDRTFTYSIPEEMRDSVRPGVRVTVPFGSRRLSGYVLELIEEPDYEADKIKAIAAVENGYAEVESVMVRLARWMKAEYGCTLNQALKTVVPVPREIRKRATRVEQVPELGKAEDGSLPPELNAAQKEAVAGILASYPKPALIFGVTGSGKTEIYMSLIAEMIRRGRQTILLIPEIALTYQNLSRFTGRFGSRVGVVNSRLSAGEKSECFRRARRGELDVMIGPRSALFTPFPNTGLIIIDEEHEGAYNSDTTPKYNAVDTARKLSELLGAGLVLGSATPSLESYTRALAGEYGLYRLPSRAVSGSVIPKVTVVDLRKELREGNRGIFSRQLLTLMAMRLQRHEQIMLFLNRRGFTGFISCRSCGRPIKCPHCDVSMTVHKNGRLVCHYCGHNVPMPDRCPACGSPYIAGFGVGTQKVEAEVKKLFPEASVLRMDMDTTSRKDGHSKILAAFGAGEADILIGTQMIVKGHDFPNVTLVGVLAADLSLYAQDFRASERTFQLLTQAAGRAGRGSVPGDVVIQTYSPDNYAVAAAARQDYYGFYRREMVFRSLMNYPPAGSMLFVLVSSEQEESAWKEAKAIAVELLSEADEKTSVIGPSDAGISKLKDQYRKQLFVKHPSRDRLLALRDGLLAAHGENVQMRLL
jgi:primosomal protein N' (replication factor Y)